MTAAELYQEDWHGFEIVGYETSLGLCVTYHCRVRRKQKDVFAFEGLVVSGDILGSALEQELLVASPQEVALQRVRAIIDLETYAPGQTIERRLYEWTKSGIPQRELRRRLLEVFYGIWQKLPKSYKPERVDMDGLCMELSISENEYFSAVDYLLGKKHLKRWAEWQDEQNYYRLHITPDGIDAYEEGLLVGPVVEELVADTREFVDSNLERLCPKAAQKLAETYASLVQGDSELRWSQVAFACRQVLQDFTDAICDPAFLGETVELPEKSKTKDKIRAALLARTPKVGKTERRLLEALSAHIDDYFDKLNRYIQKHVHPDRKDQVSAESAKRCLMYTYLLMADLLSLLL